MSKNQPTIVTMFYDIRKMEGANSFSPRQHAKTGNHQQNYYFDLSKKFILSLPYPLIIFTSDDNQQLVDMVNLERKNLLNKTEIIKINLEDTYYYKYLDRVTELQTKFTICNGDLQHETPLYILLNNNKLFFMETAVTQNPFDSSHFIWCDFGVNHVALNCEKIHEWIVCVPDKIKQLCINPYLENNNHKDTFTYIHHHTAAGLFSGSKENLLKYSELYKNKVEQIYNEEWYQLEEAIMTIIQRENPDLFDLFYGDYQGIVSNYLRPYHNMWLILRGIEKAIHHSNFNLSNNMLNYSHIYFYNNINDGDIYKYIYYRIYSDYHGNSGNLHTGTIFIINEKLLQNDEPLITLLNNNIEKLQMYFNKGLLLFTPVSNYK